MAYVPGANSTLAGNTDVPGSSASDDSLSGVSAALGVVPVAIASNPNARPAQAARPIGTGLVGKIASQALNSVNQQAVPQFQVKTISNAILDLDKLTKGQKAAVQNALYQAGYLKTVAVPGEVDSATRAAYRTAVEDAARQSQYDGNNQLVKPVTVDQVLKDRIANRVAQGIPPGDVSTAQQSQTVLTNPADIRAAVVAAAKSEYGHKADLGLVNSIIDRYQQLQSQAQQSTAPTVVNPPSLSTFATQQIRAGAPKEVALNDSLHAANLVMQAFGGSGG